MKNAGKYNKRIEIFSEAVNTDAQGFQTTSETLVLTTYAAVKTTKGFTLIAANSDFEKAYTNFTIRYPITEINAHNTSLLVFIAEHDFIVNNQNTTNLIERSKDGCNIETILVKNAYHDILNESDSVRNPTIEKIGTFFSNG